LEDEAGDNYKTENLQPVRVHDRDLGCCSSAPDDALYFLLLAFLVQCENPSSNRAFMRTNKSQ